MKKRFTHYARYPIFWNIFHIPCYYHIEENCLGGRNTFYAILLDFAIWYDFEFGDGFGFWVGSKIEQEDE